ncbi:hypothetical protein ACFV3E_05995 [Streptomyces sp. NPDC059718]
MQTFTSTELNRKSGAILQAAEDQGAVEIRKGSKVFVLRYVSADEDPTTYVSEEPVRKASPAAGTNEDVMAALLASSTQQAELLQELVDLAKRDTGPEAVARMAAELGVETAGIDEEPEPGKVRIPAPPRPQPNPEGEGRRWARQLEEARAREKARTDAVLMTARSRPASIDGAEPVQARVVAIPKAVVDETPEPAEEPTQDELEAAYDYFGLVETADGLEVTERAIQRALGTVMSVARKNPESEEAIVMKMDASDERRIEFLRLVQLDKLSKALAKRKAGDPRWLGAATPF